MQEPCAKQNILGFSWPSLSPKVLEKAKVEHLPLQKLKTSMTEYIWDITQLEDNPFSFADIQRLLDGDTVEGYEIEDEKQVFNQHTSLQHLAQIINNDNVILNKSLILQLHGLVAKEEALLWGEFRSGQVGISGTAHQPPPAFELKEIFDAGFERILSIEHPVERAFVYYCWAAMNQFFFDGNKRSSRLVMNFILMRHGYYYLSVPAAKKDDFNSAMVAFYDAKNAEPVFDLLLDCYRSASPDK